MYSAARRQGRKDLDGVFLGQDEDNDGIVDTDRNFNGIPDYDETFMMYRVEPNEYVYGLDRNHNDEPDQREDDWVADYPYDPDQRGFHLFGQVGPEPATGLLVRDVSRSGNWPAAGATAPPMRS